jgi:hypothetical protein
LPHSRARRPRHDGNLECGCLTIPRGGRRQESASLEPNHCETRSWVRVMSCAAVSPGNWRTLSSRGTILTQSRQRVAPDRWACNFGAKRRTRTSCRGPRQPVPRVLQSPKILL